MLHKFRDISKLVALSHSVFALPFAICGFVFAQQKGVLITSTHITYQIILIIIAVVLARTAAMSFNRLVDAKMDALNPRTMEREIPRGKISIWQATLLCLFSTILFFLYLLTSWQTLLGTIPGGDFLFIFSTA